MHTKVVYQSAKALADIGCVVLRFNFRGVGRSAGAWDEGRGEMDDYRTAVDYMAAGAPGPGDVGSRVFVRVLHRDDERLPTTTGSAR